MRVIGYTRISPNGRESTSGLSLEAQRRKIEAYCEATGATLVAIEEDSLETSKSLDRPALNSLLERLARGEADGLVVAKLDRLTRRLPDLLRLVETFEARHWSLASVAETIDTSTAAGRLVVNMLGVIGQWERETIGERTRDALASLKARGVRLGRKTVPRNASVVSQLQVWRGEGLTFGAIAERANAEALPTLRGGAWYPTTVQRLLREAR